MRVDRLVKQLSQDGLATAFIVEALERYANEVLSDSTDWGNSIIKKEAWQEVATQVLAGIEKERL
jgi:hypothetical protein